MLRALFILLAVVSVVLGIVLERPILYVAAGALLLVAVVMLIMAAKKRHEKSKKSYLSSSPRDQDEELAALGIADIRPREHNRARQSDDDDFAVMEEPAGVGTHATHRAGKSEAGTSARVSGDGMGETEKAAPETETAGEDLRALGIMEIRPRERRGGSVKSDAAGTSRADAGNGNDATAVPKGSDDPESPNGEAQRERLKRDVLAPYLQSAQSAIGANTVCLLRHDEDALKYHIEAIVSRNAYARTQGHFRTRVPLLKPAVARRPVLTFRVGEKGLASSNLGYYLEPIAVRQIAIAAIAGSQAEASYFLLADTMDDDGLSSARQHTLLSQFAKGLATILNGEVHPDLAAEVDQYRPRREIIAEEMDAARAQQHPLALILVYLNRAEEIAGDGEEDVQRAEATLEARLRETVGDRRLEHFGELVYGVFDKGPTADVEPWVMQLQEALISDSGPLSGGVSIGIAVLKDRHADPDAFRADANEALKEAFETGACTILE